MNKKIEVLTLTNEAELSAALRIRKKLDKVFIRQSANCLILSLLILAISFRYYFGYMEYYLFDNGVLGVLGFIALCSIAATPAFIFVHFFVKKHRPFEEEIERYINANFAMLGNSKGLLSEAELSYLSSLKREGAANLQTMEKRVRCRE
ncbi:hypothetical protein ALQ37_200193 [Pseudomonas syringae pv. aptata]|uniref:Uncharacterized protein n=1 Tax=Pseudomonas syringae pv. aptata TaxID=83167 RepID=A0A3M3X692_PSEAP|nr:hypothetical protein [Pseudomonas syringae]RMO65469.1 hypothetical protein ALQ37_200193 [Pseudomonas syringae pv. aptata]